MILAGLTRINYYFSFFLDVRDTPICQLAAAQNSILIFCIVFEGRKLHREVYSGIRQKCARISSPQHWRKVEFGADMIVINVIGYTKCDSLSIYHIHLIYTLVLPLKFHQDVINIEPLVQMPTNTIKYTNRT
ncbi:hypothetical protein HZ326_21432 [Fusarium oxysporum f. sp. albedinis]|nr:hypothetical protein HZ326_21432 [Fusarium oxysporum f. sp. albedinis]